MEKILDIFLILIFYFCYFIFATNESKYSKEHIKALIIRGSIILVIFFSFRDIGLDLEAYKVLFENAPVINIDSDFFTNMLTSYVEPVHAILFSEIKKVGLGFSVYLLISALIPIGIISNLILVKANKPILAFFLFSLTILFPAMDAIRHFVAVAVYLSALKSLSEKSRVRFYLKNIFSFFIHYSNAIVVFMQPFLTIKWNIKKYFLLLILTTVIALLFLQGIQIFLKNLNGFEGNALLFKLNYYVNNTDLYEYTGELHFWLLGLRSYFFSMFILLLNIYILSKRWKFSTDFHQIVFNSQIIGSILALFLIVLGAREFGARVNFLLSIGNFFILEDILVSKQSQLIIKSKFYVVATILGIYNLIIILYLAGIHQPQSPFYLGL